MKKRVFLTAVTVALATNVQAITIFSDADYFGTIHTGGGANPPNGSPNGITLTFGGGSASTTTTFDFVTSDSTASFVIGTPYTSVGRGTFVSQLGFTIGQDIVEDGNITLWLRDPSGGSESVAYTSHLNSQSIGHGSFSTSLLISEYITAQVMGYIDADGFISYTVAASAGSFVLDAAMMEIVTHRIPDGGLTVALLGFALVSVESLRRKLKK